MSRVVATVGAIPGAGATTVVAGLGSALAEQRHHVALVDASAEGSRIANVLSLDGDGTVADALRRRADLAEVQTSGPHGVSAFPADPDTNWAAIRPGAVAELYDTLRDRFEIVLVDCGSAITPASAAWLGYADELLVVTDPDVPDAVQGIAGVGEAFDVPVRGLVANRVVRDELSTARTALESTGEAVLAILPEDPAVGAAAGDRRSVLMEAPDSPIASCLWELARRLSEGDHATPVVPEPWTDGPAGGASGTASGATGGRSTDGGSAADDASPTSTDAATPSADDASAPPADESSPAAGVDATADSVGATDGSGTAGASAASDASPSDTASTSADASATDDASPTTDSSPTADASTAGLGDAATSGTTPTADGGAGDATTGTAPDTGAGASSAGDAGSADDADDPFEFSDPGEGSDLGVGPGDATTSDTGTGGVGEGDDAAGSTSSSGATDATATGDDGEEDATISDDEIEEVFKETMQRVKEEKDEEKDDDEDDSVLGGFMGG